MERSGIKLSLLVTMLLLLGHNLAQAQGRVVMNNDAYMVMNGGGVYVVIDNSATNAITELGTGGRIVSEDEDNKIRWIIGTGTGTYTIPWNSNPATSNTEIPFAMNITAAGVGAGQIDFSCYETSTDMNSPWPSMVTHMNDYATGSVDNSLFVMDRFWLIDAQGYTTKPTPTFSFGYVDVAAEMGGTNTITEANLQAQRFDDGAGLWNGPPYLYGTANTGANTVTGVSPGVADFFTAWTLVDNVSPLPIELLTYEGNCNNDNAALIEWSTASETNSSHFVLAKSSDGISFMNMTTLDAAGNSTSVRHYSYLDENPYIPVTYYKLTQYDQDDESETMDMIAITGCGSSNAISIYTQNNEHVNVVMNMGTANDYVLNIYDMSGRAVVTPQTLTTTKGMNSFIIPTNVAPGAYMVIIENQNERYSNKLILK